MGSDEDAVLRAFDDLDRACSGTDPDVIVRLFTADPDITFWGSAEAEQAVGTVELQALAETIANAPGSFSIEWHERRVVIEGDTAWVNASGVARWDRGTGDIQQFPYRATGVLRRRDANWRWHTFNGSEPQVD